MPLVEHCGALGPPEMGFLGFSTRSEFLMSSGFLGWNVTVAARRCLYVCHWFTLLDMSSGPGC